MSVERGAPSPGDASEAPALGTPFCVEIENVRDNPRRRRRQSARKFVGRVKKLTRWQSLKQSRKAVAGVFIFLGVALILAVWWLIRELAIEWKHSAITQEVRNDCVLDGLKQRLPAHVELGGCAPDGPLRFNTICNLACSQDYREVAQGSMEVKCTQKGLDSPVFVLAGEHAICEAVVCWIRKDDESRRAAGGTPAYYQVDHHMKKSSQVEVNYETNDEHKIMLVEKEDLEPCKCAQQREECSFQWDPTDTDAVYSYCDEYDGGWSDAKIVEVLFRTAHHSFKGVHGKKWWCVDSAKEKTDCGSFSFANTKGTNDTAVNIWTSGAGGPLVKGPGSILAVTVVVGKGDERRTVEWRQVCQQLKPKGKDVSQLARTEGKPNTPTVMFPDDAQVGAAATLEER